MSAGIVRVPRRESSTAATISGIHDALVQSYDAEAADIDPRLRFMDIEPAELASANRDQPHSIQMARTAQRLRNGELIAVEARRVHRLLGAEDIRWLADWRGGVVVGPDDSISRAGPNLLAHW